MAIGRTLQQKVNAPSGQAKREALSWRPESTPTSAKVQPVVHSSLEKYFLLDLRKTLFSTLFIAGLLAYAYWILR